MRIFITIPSMRIVGGIERVTSLQANYWAELKNYEVYIITYANPVENTFYPLSSKVRIVDLKIDSHLLNSKFRPMEKRKLMKLYKDSFVKAYLSYKPQIIFTTMHGIETYLLKDICPSVPVVGINHVSLAMRRGTYLHGFDWFLNCFRYAYQKRKFKKFDCMVALSRTDELWFKEMGCKAIYIPNPVCFEEKETTVGRGKYVICVGRLDYLKGQDRLLEIWREIAPIFPDWKLLLVGDGRKKHELENVVMDYEISESVVFTGNRKDVSHLLKQSSIFAFASRTESFGMVLLEALEKGLPVISYDCETGPRDIVHSYYNGFLIKDGDKKSYIQKLALLMRDKSLRESCGKNAIEFASRFDVNRIMPIYDDLMHSICNKKYL